MKRKTNRLLDRNRYTRELLGLVTIPEACEMLKVSQHVFRTMVKAGKIVPDGITLSGAKRYTRKYIEEKAKEFESIRNGEQV